MKKYFILSIFLFSICGCDSTNRNKEIEYWKQIHYFKDKRTNLCFASTSCRDCNDYTMTCVPCSKKVLSLIEDNVK